MSNADGDRETAMEGQDKPLSLVLFPGTDDKLTAASVLASAPQRWAAR